MNENEMHENGANPCDPTKCDPLPMEDPKEVSNCEPQQREELQEAIGGDKPTVWQDIEAPVEPDSEAFAEDLELLADSPADPDSDHTAPVETSAEEQLRQLRDELTQLRKDMTQKDAILSRMGEECEEFHALYPETPLSALPDNVWADVKLGIPLAAAYALAERRRAYTEALAASANRQNGQRSTGALEATEPDYFSPGEVRAMTQDEVRANYQKIMRSMQKWR